jgi:DNA-binding response OmpR family regulator
VLVIDDHDLCRQFTVQALRQTTQRVKQAGSGREGLKLAIRFKPDLIFLDVQLPDTDGFSLLEQIRTAWPEDFSQPTFVILTGDSLLDTSKAHNLPGDVAIIMKPARRRDIRELATRHLSHFRCVRQNMEKHANQAPHPALRRVFLRDLETQCPLLDQHIAGLDWRSARDLLHQMIAASAMCREARVELYCRLLNDELADSRQPEPLSQAYFGLLRAIDQSRHDFTPGESPRAFP